MKQPKDLTDDELELCIDGSTNLAMIRDILSKSHVVDLEGYVDPEAFADWFAHGLEGYINAESDSKEWQEAYDENWNWGYDIGDNINSFTTDNFKETE